MASSISFSDESTSYARVFASFVPIPPRHQSYSLIVGLMLLPRAGDILHPKKIVELKNIGNIALCCSIVPVHIAMFEMGLILLHYIGLSSNILLIKT